MTAAAIAVRSEHYRLHDAPSDVVLVACTKCDWKAAYSSEELIAADRAMPDVSTILPHRVAPGLARRDSAAHILLEPIQGRDEHTLTLRRIQEILSRPVPTSSRESSEKSSEAKDW